MFVGIQLLVRPFRAGIPTNSNPSSRLGGLSLTFARIFCQQHECGSSDHRDTERNTGRQSPTMRGYPLVDPNTVFLLGYRHESWNHFRPVIFSFLLRLSKQSQGFSAIDTSHPLSIVGPALQKSCRMMKHVSLLPRNRCRCPDILGWFCKKFQRPWVSAAWHRVCHEQAIEDTSSCHRKRRARPFRLVPGRRRRRRRCTPCRAVICVCIL
mmetsp:Transcript_16986/g.39000  ORF Transcript_16986/g.39000 Transcript_16986/m.39000 type:complete len:210 (-) Transcript_16986:743-1372(-)